MSTINSSSLIFADFASFHRKTLIFAPNPAPKEPPPPPHCRRFSFRPPLSVSRPDFLGRLLSKSSNAVTGRGYASVAEAVSVESESVAVAVEEEEEIGELGELLINIRSRGGGGGYGRGMSRKRLEILRRRQVKIETEAWENAAREYRDLLADMCEQRLAPTLPYMKSLFLGWFEPFSTAIAKEQEVCRRRTTMVLAPYMGQLPAEMMAVITMHKLMGLLMTKEEQHGSARVITAAIAVGDAIEQEVKIQRFLAKKKDGPDEENEGELDATKVEEKLKKRVAELMKQQKLRAVRQIVQAQDDSKPWGQVVKAKLGSRLIELLIQTAYIQPPSTGQLADYPPDVRPAFVHTTRSVMKDAKKNGRRVGIIQCDALVLQGFERNANHMVIPYMPMLVPPVNWTGYDKGGHFFLPSYIMRTHGAKQQREAVRRAPRNQLAPVFKALDSLGNTKWRINTRVLSVVERIWSSGGCLADLVDRTDVPSPEKPDTEDETLLRKWKREVRFVRKQNRERYAQRCDIELKLSVARKMKDEEGFYYPHNVDFRGRAYPMHPYLNHLGSDLCRGILEFAEGRPLGESGLRWLKIHLANLYAAGGVDKLSHEDRLAFTETHLDEIFDSADSPLDGNCWWLTAEDPFQCLAACFNLVDALRSPSPETFFSYAHVHQDGSCNGLQHYAALGRDELGATAVNMVAGDKPADVYSVIAERVLKIMRRDAQEDPLVNADALQAKLLVNQVDRKLVKQTVMTSVYGVTYIGARDQIGKRLKERGVIVDEQEIFACSCYAAKITLAALGEMFQGARSIMSWLSECAKIISTQNEPVRWKTPMGLPVVQPYRKLGRRAIKTSLQMLTIQRETGKVMASKQKTAFPPNFVHSLDGSHMMMTAVACRKAGITFAGVHDSYWTHACDVDELSRILREKFVELYETLILEDLLENFQQSFPELSFPPLPERGDFDLKSVLDSTYFFN